MRRILTNSTNVHFSMFDVCVQLVYDTKKSLVFVPFSYQNLSSLSTIPIKMVKVGVGTMSLLLIQALYSAKLVIKFKIKKAYISLRCA